MIICPPGQGAGGTEGDDPCFVEVRKVLLELEISLLEVEQVECRPVEILAEPRSVNGAAAGARRKVAGIERDKCAPPVEVERAEPNAGRLTQSPFIGG